MISACRRYAQQRLKKNSLGTDCTVHDFVNLGDLKTQYYLDYQIYLRNLGGLRHLKD